VQQYLTPEMTITMLRYYKHLISNDTQIYFENSAFDNPILHYIHFTRYSYFNLGISNKQFN